MMFGGMWLLWLVIIGGIILLVKVFVDNQNRRSGAQDSRDALDILRERYARGEISREEFEERKQNLS